MVASLHFNTDHYCICELLKPSLDLPVSEFTYTLNYSDGDDGRMKFVLFMADGGAPRLGI